MSRPPPVYQNFISSPPLKSSPTAVSSSPSSKNKTRRNRVSEGSFPAQTNKLKLHEAFFRFTEMEKSAGVAEQRAAVVYM